MSPLRMGSATVTVVTAAELADRAAALSQACTEGARELEPAQVCLLYTSDAADE